MMPKLLKRLFKALLWIGLIVVLYIAMTLIHGTLTDYQPSSVIPLKPEQESPISIIEDSILSFTTWNVGFGGLGAESEFFFDNGYLYFSHGKMVRVQKEYVEKNVKGMVDFAASTKSDFFLLQEVDYNSKRSYYTNEFEQIKQKLPNFSAFFAPNYKVDRVPIPVMEPWQAYGKTHSGLGTYSKYQPYKSTRYQLPGSFAWPTRIFQLDRCVSSHRFKVKGNKELVVMNVHNSAYDMNGALKKEQMAFLREMVMEEYKKGAYVVVGGDWNQCPPFFKFNSFSPDGDSDGYSQINIAADFLPEDWQWVYDPRVPTNRKTKSVYVPNKTFVTIIDFFLISPNIRVHTVKGINQNFQYSDHQPVWMEVELLD